MQAKDGEFQILQRFYRRVSEVWILGITNSTALTTASFYLQFSIAFSIGIPVIAVLVIMRQIRSILVDYSFNNFDFDVKKSEKKNGDEDGETVAWLNAVIERLWPILDVNLLIAGQDLLRDTLIRVSPALFRGVRVGEFNLGALPIRLEKFKILGDAIDITRNDSEEENDGNVKHEEGSSGNAKHVEGLPTLSSPDEESNTRFINLECGFSLLQPIINSNHSTNMASPHFLLHLAVRIKKLVKLKIPVLVEITQLSGVIRLRLELIPDPPFVRHVQFTFTTIPKISITAKPLGGSINLMHLPILSPYIQSSIESVFLLFTAPLSYTIDLSRFLLGSDVKMSIDSIGVVVVFIKSAKNLPEDKESFVTVSLSNHARVLYRSRTLDSKPEFNELAYITITAEDVEEGGILDLRLNSGFASSIPLLSLSSSPGVYQESLESDFLYSAAFFPLAKSVPHTINSNSSPNSDAPTKKPKPFYSNPNDVGLESIASSYAHRMREMLDGRSPANVKALSGILSLQIHSGRFENEDSHDDTMSSSDHDHDHHRQNSELSTFCRCVINDEFQFDTRVKANTLLPYYNHSAELFIADWTTSSISIMVLNQKHSDIIGIVAINLKEVLSKASQCSKSWSVDFGSDGKVGKIRISLLFKPIDILINPTGRIPNVGILKIESLKLVSLSQHLAGTLTLSVEGGSTITTHNTGTIRSTESKNREYQIDFSLEGEGELAVFNHSTAALSVLFIGVNTMNRKEVEIGGVIFLSNFMEMEDNYRIPLYRGSFDHRNYSRPSSDSPSLPTLPPKFKSIRNSVLPTRSVITSNTQTIPIETSFGTLEITTSFIPGFSKSHEIDSITLTQSYALQSYLIQQCSVDSKERGQNRTATMNMDDGSNKQVINEGKGKKAMKWFGRKVKSEVENIRN